MEYKNTLSKFGTKLEDRNQRVKFTHLPTRYRVKFMGFASPLGGENLTMDMVDFPTPSGNFAKQTIETVNGEIKYPGKWTWDDVTFNVYNSYDNICYKELFRQIQLQRDLSEQVTGTVPQNYKFVTVFEHTDGHQNAIASWVMEGCVLLSAKPSGGKNGDHSASTISCSMCFDNASLYDADGTLITGSGATSTLLEKVLAC